MEGWHGACPIDDATMLEFTRLYIYIYILYGQGGLLSSLSFHGASDEKGSSVSV